MKAKRRSSFWRGVRQKLSLLLAGIGLTCLVIFLTVFEPPVYKRVDLFVQDQLLSWSRGTLSTAPPVIVAIDDKSLEMYGQWPWPRYRVAMLLDTIRQMGAASVGVDMVFAEQDRSSPVAIREALARDAGVDISLEGVPENLRDNDAIMARALEQGPYVLGYFFNFEANPEQVVPASRLSIACMVSDNDDSCLSSLMAPTNAVASLPEFGSATRSEGFLNCEYDPDGILRRVPLVAAYKGRVWPNLSLETLMRGLGLRQAMLSREPDRSFTLSAGPLRIPLDEQGNMAVRYRGPGRTFEYIPAWKILQHEPVKEELAGRLVFVGATASGLTDLKQTPFDAVMPGVEVHASIVDTIIAGDYLHHQGWTLGLEVLAIAVAGLVATLFVTFAGPSLSLLACALLGASSMILSTRALAAWGALIPYTGVVLAVAGVLILLTAMKYWAEYARARRRARELALSQEGTIEGFAAIAEYRDPETGGHIQRTRSYIETLARHISRWPKYRRQLGRGRIKLIAASAPLHDIGKVGVPDGILLKPGFLTDDEFEVMKNHPVYGAAAIGAVIRKVGENEFLETAMEIIRFHHEKWDGSGYPDGLAGEDIPLPARLMALADVYDALVSERVYKPAFSHNRAVGIIERASGQHFDPDLVRAFLDINEAFLDIALRHADSESQKQSLLADKNLGADQKELKDRATSILKTEGH